ncbi:hypothetical protein QP866_06805 [Corynebacterium imitans]|uniref:hypothetical protein n=1 Tax=Corynebacterium imitans TaxID=156978 RepID=UPI00254E880C|nr:hypothetical protein [Corynebacterium imitans]MDK8637536.1 hypothetical protein [Corynebacterium imitans]MDK8772098.1 hypothetical protein [Corynebacterium imitans]
MRDWHRGEISTRRLRALIQWLPPGNAIDRARDNGRSWGLDQQMVWQLLGELRRLNMYTRAELRVKPHQDKFVWPTTPWEPDEESTRVGAVSKRDQQAAAAYLLALTPSG